MFQTVFKIYISDVLHSMISQEMDYALHQKMHHKNAFSVYIKEKKENEMKLQNLGYLSITFNGFLVRPFL